MCVSRNVTVGVGLVNMAAAFKSRAMYTVRWWWRGEGGCYIKKVVAIPLQRDAQIIVTVVVFLYYILLSYVKIPKIAVSDIKN